MIAASALVITVPALVISLLTTPVYSAQAEVLLQSRTSETLFDPTTSLPTDPRRQVRNEIRVVSSAPVRAAVETQLGPVPKATARAVGASDVISVSVRSTDPARAAVVANAYATSYIEHRRKQAVDDVLAATRQVQSKMSELQQQIDAATAGAQRESLVASQGLFKQKLDQLQVDGALKQGGAELVTSATVPSSPVSPRPLRTGLVALLFGVGIGVGLALLRELLDDSVRTKADFERLVPDVPVLGLIPVVSTWRGKDGPYLVSLEERTSPAAEAYRTLRTSVQFIGLDQPVQTLQITSANTQEGKTTTLANLGVALARSGPTVAIVCCDLRRPRVHEFFGLPNDVGFTSVLLGKVPLAGAVQEVPAQARLSLLSSGPLPPNPSELLSSRRTVEVLGSLQAEYDIVLIDAPPVLPVTDSLILSGRVDATLLVVVAGSTSRREVARAMELLRQVDAPVVGAVINGAETEDLHGYTYESAVDGRMPTPG
jgi:capsular exopolysaccharide synthesis family protein